MLSQIKTYCLLFFIILLLTWFILIRPFVFELYCSRLNYLSARKINNLMRFSCCNSSSDHKIHVFFLLLHILHEQHDACHMWTWIWSLFQSTRYHHQFYDGFMVSLLYFVYCLFLSSVADEFVYNSDIVHLSMLLLPKDHCFFLKFNSQ